MMSVQEASIGLLLIVLYGGIGARCFDSVGDRSSPIPIRPTLNRSLELDTFPWTTNTTFVNSTILYDVRIVASLKNRLWQKYALDIELCMESCTEECQVVDYDIRGKICTAYNVTADIKFVQSYHFAIYSPIRKQLARLPGFWENRGMIGLEYQDMERAFNDEMTELLCQKLCLLHPQCETAIFRVRLKSCQLKRQYSQPSKFRQKPIADQGAITFFSNWKEDFIVSSLWSDEECWSWKTGGCYMSGCSYIDCKSSASDVDIGKHIEKVGRNLQEGYPLIVQISGKLRFEPASFEPILDRVIAFLIHKTRGFDSVTLSSLHLPNLLALDFHDCKNVTVRRGTLNNFPQLRVLHFTYSTILHLETGVLEELPHLKILVLDLGIEWPLDVDYRSHLWKFHCSREYSWFRTYLANNPHLIQPKQEGEVFSEGEILSPEWWRRKIYAAVDCQKDNLEGLDDQIEFSLNPEN